MGRRPHPCLRVVPRCQRGHGARRSPGPGVTKACFYEPEINPTYAELAAHYGTVVLPTRTAKPRDKAAAEAGVLTVERWVLAPLRTRTFFSLADLNAAIWRRAQRR